MSRWPVFVLVAAIALGAGVGLAQVRSMISERSSGAASQGTAPTGGDDELVARVLTSPFSPSGKPQGAQLLRGALPTQPTVDAPMPQGSKLIGSVVRTSGGAAASVQVVLDAGGTVADVTTFYERELASLGWKPMPDRGGPGGGGFQPASPPTSKTFCKGDGIPWLSLMVFSRENSPNDVRLNYQLLNEFGGGTPCSQQASGPQHFVSKLPALRPPSDVQFRGGSGMSGSTDRQVSETSAATTRGAAELETHFAGQLSAAGWTRIAGGATGPVAWSTWKLPGDGDWTGMLLVIETGSDRRLLSVRAESATAFR